MIHKMNSMINIFDICWSAILEESKNHNHSFFAEKNCLILDSRDTNFDIVENRLAYICTHGYLVISLVEKCIFSFLEQCTKEEKQFFSKNSKICSLSNGPGVDIVGYLYALFKSSIKLNSIPEIHAINLHGSWTFLFQKIVPVAYKAYKSKSKIDHIEIPSENIQLIQGDVFSTVLDDAKKHIVQTDVLLMVHVFNSTKANFDVVSNSLKNIWSLLKPRSHVFFIGSANSVKKVATKCSLEKYVKFGPVSVSLTENNLYDSFVDKTGIKIPKLVNKAHFLVLLKPNTCSIENMGNDTDTLKSKKKNNRRKKAVVMPVPSNISEQDSFKDSGTIAHIKTDTKSNHSEITEELIELLDVNVGTLLQSTEEYQISSYSPQSQSNNLSHICALESKENVNNIQTILKEETKPMTVSSQSSNVSELEQSTSKDNGKNSDESENLASGWKLQSNNNIDDSNKSELSKSYNSLESSGISFLSNDELTVMSNELKAVLNLDRTDSFTTGLSVNLLPLDSKSSSCGEINKEYFVTNQTQTVRELTSDISEQFIENESRVGENLGIESKSKSFIKMVETSINKEIKCKDKENLIKDLSCKNSSETSIDVQKYIAPYKRSSNSVARKNCIENNVQPKIVPSLISSNIQNIMHSNAATIVLQKNSSGLDILKQNTCHKEPINVSLASSSTVNATESKSVNFYNEAVNLIKIKNTSAGKPTKHSCKLVQTDDHNQESGNIKAFNSLVQHCGTLVSSIEKLVENIKIDTQNDENPVRNCCRNNQRPPSSRSPNCCRVQCNVNVLSSHKDCTYGRQSCYGATGSSRNSLAPYLVIPVKNNNIPAILNLVLRDS